MKPIAYAIALALLAGPVAAQDVIEGKALALDGDTILVTPKDGKAVKVRLWGVDAPEMKDWPWGPLARGYVDTLLFAFDGQVRCEPKGQSHNRIVARCELVLPDPSNTIDIGEGLIGAGLAVEYRAFGRGFYYGPEAEALSKGRGVWKHWHQLRKQD